MLPVTKNKVHNTKRTNVYLARKFHRGSKEQALHREINVPNSYDCLITTSLISTTIGVRTINNLIA